MHFCEDKNGVSLIVTVLHHKRKYTLTVARLPNIHTSCETHNKNGNLAKTLEEAVEFRLVEKTNDGRVLMTTYGRMKEGE